MQERLAQGRFCPVVGSDIRAGSRVALHAAVRDRGGSALLRPPGLASTQSAPRFAVCGVLFTLHSRGRAAGRTPLDSVHMPAMRPFLSKQETYRWLVHGLQIPGLTPFCLRVLEAVYGKERWPFEGSLRTAGDPGRKGVAQFILWCFDCKEGL